MKEEIQPLRQQEVKAGESSDCGEGKPKEKSQKEGTFTTVITKKGDTSGTMALREIPVFLRNWQKMVKVNALWDVASTKTYVNSNVAAKLGLQGIYNK